MPTGTQYTKEERAEKLKTVFESLAMGHFLETALAKAGLPHSTFQSWLRKDKDLQQRYDDAYSMGTGQWGEQLFYRKDLDHKGTKTKDLVGIMGMRNRKRYGGGKSVEVDTDNNDLKIHISFGSAARRARAKPRTKVKKDPNVKRKRGRPRKDGN